MSATLNSGSAGDDLITIATFSHPTEADPVVAWLESEGIECFLTNEHTVSMNWLYSNAIGGVGVRIRAADVERANEILQIISNPDATGEETAPVDLETTQGNEDATDVYCPQCSSADVYYEKFSRRLVFASWVLLTVPLPFFKKRWKCRECEHQFK